METQDGFIVGVYNYCDRWCERCALASRCRVRATELQIETAAPRSAARTTAPGATGSPLLRSLGAVAASFSEGAPAGAEEPDQPSVSASPSERHQPLPSFGSPVLPPQHADLHRRAHALGMRLWAWPMPARHAHDPAALEHFAVIRHFGVYVGPKVYRALIGREAGEADGMLSDALGSAKAALLAFDRMSEAWLRLAEHSVVGVLDAAPILSDLQRVSMELEAAFPRAYDFVRPGFDEPHEVALLEWRERG